MNKATNTYEMDEIDLELGLGSSNILSRIDVSTYSDEGI
jgi:hypothetical protein